MTVDNMDKASQHTPQVQPFARNPSDYSDHVRVQALQDSISESIPNENSQDPIVTSSNLKTKKIEDAVSYLKEIKSRYSDRLQVYYDFLVIMKETNQAAKSQSVNIPEVIIKISRLFEDQPDLIAGFSKFLPPGVQESSQ